MEAIAEVKTHIVPMVEHGHIIRAEFTLYIQCWKTQCFSRRNWQMSEGVLGKYVGCHSHSQGPRGRQESAPFSPPHRDGVRSVFCGQSVNILMSQATGSNAAFATRRSSTHNIIRRNRETHLFWQPHKTNNLYEEYWQIHLSFIDWLLSLCKAIIGQIHRWAAIIQQADMDFPNVIRLSTQINFSHHFWGSQASPWLSGFHLHLTGFTKSHHWSQHGTCIWGKIHMLRSSGQEWPCYSFSRLPIHPEDPWRSLIWWQLTASFRNSAALGRCSLLMFTP